MNDVVLSPQTIGVVTSLLGAMAFAISALTGGIVVLYREANKRNDAAWRLLFEERNAGWQRLIDERDARLVDLFRNLEEKEIRIKGLEYAQERYYQLAAQSTEVLQQAIAQQRKPA